MFIFNQYLTIINLKTNTSCYNYNFSLSESLPSNLDFLTMKRKYIIVISFNQPSYNIFHYYTLFLSNDTFFVWDPILFLIIF